jgi:hypothetical protein
MAHVFISFIHEEEEYASCTKTFIESTLGNEARAFLSSDKWAIYAGDLWLDRIVRELREAKVVVAMLSPESVRRPWVNFEAGAAFIREDCRLIPVCFNGLTKEALPKPYSSIQAVDLMSVDDQYYLIRSIKHHLGMRALDPLPPLQPLDDEKYVHNHPYFSLKKCIQTAGLIKRAKDFVDS